MVLKVQVSFEYKIELDFLILTKHMNSLSKTNWKNDLIPSLVHYKFKSELLIYDQMYV